MRRPLTPAGAAAKAYVRLEQERCGGCDGDLRGGEPAGDALRGD